MHWVFLGVAIVLEVVGTSFLKESNGFQNLAPTLVSIAAYVCAFYFLSLAIRSLELGIAYAIWAGVGTALIVLISWLFFNQSLDAAAVVGVLLIILGVIVINVFSEVKA